MFVIGVFCSLNQLLAFVSAYSLDVWLCLIVWVVFRLFLGVEWAEMGLAVRVIVFWVVVDRLFTEVFDGEFGIGVEGVIKL